MNLLKIYMQFTHGQFDKYFYLAKGKTGSLNAIENRIFKHNIYYPLTRKQIFRKM